MRCFGEDDERESPVPGYGAFSPIDRRRVVQPLFGGAGAPVQQVEDASRPPRTRR